MEAAARFSSAAMMGRSCAAARDSPGISDAASTLLKEVLSAFTLRIRSISPEVRRGIRRRSAFVALLRLTGRWTIASRISSSSSETTLSSPSVARFERMSSSDWGEAGVRLTKTETKSQ
jgi:hypothetical protein